MDETMNATEGMAQTSDAFLDGWDDTAAESTADQPESDGAERMFRLPEETSTVAV